MMLYVVRRAVCTAIMSGAILFPACAEEPKGDPAGLSGELPTGLGYIIKDIRAYTVDKWDSNTLIPGKFLCADLHMDLMRAHLNPNLAEFKHAVAVPKALGRTTTITVTVPQNKDKFLVTVPTHGMDEIGDYIRLSGADWVAVKCTSETKVAPHWDENLVRTLTSPPRNLKLYGIHTLCPSDGKKQAETLLRVCRNAKLKPHGIVITPLGDKANEVDPGFFESPDATQVAQDFIARLEKEIASSTMSLAVIYCPPAGISLTSGTAVIAHRAFMEFIGRDTATRALMPRFYWKAVRKEDSNGNADQKLDKRIERMMDDFVMPHLAQTTSPMNLIPVGQAQRHEPHNKKIRNASGVSKFIRQLRRYNHHEDTTIPAVCFYAFENFTMQDHAEFAKVAFDANTTWPLPKKGGTPPSHKHISNDWVPGIVKSETLTSFTLDYPADRTQVRGHRDDPNDCLPVEPR